MLRNAWEPGAGFTGARRLAGHRGPGSAVLLQLPTEFQDLAYAVHVQDDPLCGTVVDFVWGSGFPVRHIIRRTVPASSPASCRSPHGHAHPIGEHWYEYVH